MAFTDAGLRHTPYKAKVSDTWGTCANRHLLKQTDGSCPTDGTTVEPLRVEQRRLVWADEAAMARDAATKRGSIDPVAALAVIMERTVRNANFTADLEALEPEQGWYLFRWLEIPEAIGAIRSGVDAGKK